MANPENNNKKKEEKQKSGSSFALFVLLLFVIFTIGIYFFVWPEYGILADSQSELASQKQLLDGQNQTFLSTKKLLANYAEISADDEAKIQTMIPATLDESDLFTLFEYLAQNNHITVSAIDISEKDAATMLANLGLREVDVALNLSANPASENQYGDFKNFLAGLETNLRLMDVISINYTPETSSYILNVRTYRLGTTPASQPAAQTGTATQ